MRMSATIASAASLALAVGGGMFAASSAQAVTASHASLGRAAGEFRYKAAAGQANRLKVTAKDVDVDSEDYYETHITFRDTYDIALSTNACRYPSAADHKVVECTAEAGVGGTHDADVYDVDLGDGNDTATVTGPTLETVRGGKGNDVLKGDSGAVLYGDDGNDRLDGGGGVYGTGASGGAGDDTLTGCDTTCHGGPGDDVLTGTASGQEFGLYGDDGDDVVHGGAGADLLSGGRGDDRLYGDSGNDRIYGNSGDDLLHGGTGTDTLSGGPGADRVNQS
ncbi:calcium-binding protein [Streptomyces sp. NPDC127038]|uniref:calcium-binding protein n=1 Tax=Streptomyces sp. NPDC127038 TaxID=3347114 RepID=UPI003656CCD1